MVRNTKNIPDVSWSIGFAEVKNAFLRVEKCELFLRNYALPIKN